MGKDLVFEIGCEEIPASFISRGLGHIETFLKTKLGAAKLSFREIKTFGTPRRLCAIVYGLEEKQPDAVAEVRGPQKSAGFVEGKPSKALEGFARAQGVDLNGLKLVDTGKGEYFYAIKNIKGVETASILPNILTELMSQEFFPKSMRWGNHDISFARPVHWILALFGKEKIPFSYGHVNSSDETFGHRFLSPASTPSKGKGIRITGPEDYLKKLREAFVMADPEERKIIIKQGLEKTAKEAGGEILPDAGLVEEVAFLVEYPVVVRGSFEDEFLKLPRDVVVNAMREHQRYFSVVNADGKLLPYFITIANTKAADIDIVRKGNERVLRARLNDAKFHFEQDTKKPLYTKAEKLKGVVFQAKLGTSYEKVERFARLALGIGAHLGYSELLANESVTEFLKDALNPAGFDSKKGTIKKYNMMVIGRAAMLSKADLTCGMVGEFPKLQGVMGSIYATMDKEAPEVATAISEHYLPTVSGGVLPATKPGAIISIADKLDTIAGCFGVGLIPSGTQDPYALRRQSLGVIAIILDQNLRVGLDLLVNDAIKFLKPKFTRSEQEVRADVMEFFKERLKNQLLGQGYSFDSIDAVLSAPWFDLVDSVKKVAALEGFKKDPSCATLVTSFKRISNILKGQPLDGKPDASAFVERAEIELHEASVKIAPKVEHHWKKGEYAQVFETLISIKDRIDAFFDKVMVMAEDEKLRKNRLLLLGNLRDMYFNIADLSKLVV